MSEGKRKLWFKKNVAGVITVWIKWDPKTMELNVMENKIEWACGERWSNEIEN